MEIQVQPMKRCQVVNVSGQIDSANAPEFESSLLELIQAGKKNLVINLGDVDFISSAGLSALLRARIRLRKRIPPGDVALAELSPKMKGTFELVGMHHLFQIYDREVDAVGSF